MKKSNRIVLSGLVLSMLFFLSGCVKTKNGVPTGEGWVYKLLVEPMGNVIQFFAENQGLGFGVAIIVVTICVRLLILPLGIYQSWKATYQSEKMHYLKPILAPIQERMKNASSQEEQLAAQQELFATQKEYGVSIFGGMGCLPLLIQMPFFSALFYAARYTEGIADASFMGIALGKSSLILTAVAGVLYFFQSLLMQVGMEDEQKQQMKTMMLMNPLMIVFLSWSSPAGVTLYWVVGGIIGIIQQVITNFFLKPKLRRQVAEEFEQNPPKPLHTSTRVKTETPTMDTAITSSSKKKNRNAGKQRSR
ncbi:membrane protein insertase YidC [Streptococcus acidominimus]|uniref:Membrane protein insertase YidC n=1 Tax=Streptococcus acidominimus TaxID=1326 RepID=A0A1Q8EDX3_STRAI|nr:membrane protein insertase YidC [Streptococcus acidominimus]MBF0846868.1 membrane protein insertase YidC [Streptococcus danieliae]MBF0819528.1 membrane protein insertase YidC [Streptococcus acidominimus]MBF0839239.1 membrane protein insertase YidC [Streptococcus acidominimus]OLF50001.1 membrane protein insertase YidC [Streptococcus acidominimus]TFU29776.1 membrane protein insertase YidC [Streptococcus acidominimus]